MNPTTTPINGTCENSCEYTQPAEVPFGCPQVDCPEPVRLVIPNHDVEVQSDCDTTETKQAGLTVEAVIPASNIVNVKVIDCGNSLDPEIICVAPIASPTDAPLSAVIVFGKTYPTDINDYKIYLGNVDVTATHMQVACDQNLDYEQVASCYQLISDANYKYTRIDWFEKSNLFVPIQTVWFDVVLEAYLATAPANVVRCQSDVFVPHVSGCIKRTVPGVPVQVCSQTVNTFSFSSSDFVTITKVADDGNGNYSAIQELSSTVAKNNFLNFLVTATVANSRTVENINGGGLFYYLGNQSITNIVDLSANQVQYDFSLEVGVSDIPSVLPAPCVDPITQQQYSDSSLALRTIFDGFTLNDPVNNAGATIEFIVTNYALQNVFGPPTVEYIPAKQVVKQLADGSYDERYYVQGDMSSEIAFDINTDEFGIECGPCKKEIFATHEKFYTDVTVAGENCIAIQEIKEKDSCTGVETYRYVVEGGNGELVDASLAIAGFDESKVLSSCPSIPEVDGVVSNWLPVCVDGVQWFTREFQTFDNTSGQVIETVKQYKQGADGTISEVAPTGNLVVDGTCYAKECSFFSAAINSLEVGANMWVMQEITGGSAKWTNDGGVYPAGLANGVYAKLNSGNLFTVDVGGMIIGAGIMDASTIMTSYVPAQGQFTLIYNFVDVSSYGLTAPYPALDIATAIFPSVTYTFYDIIETANPNVPVTKLCLPLTDYEGCGGQVQQSNALPVVVVNSKDIRREYYCDIIDDTKILGALSTSPTLVNQVNPRTGITEINSIYISDISTYGTAGARAYVSENIQANAHQALSGAVTYIVEYNIETHTHTAVNPVPFAATYVFGGVTHRIRGASLAYVPTTGNYVLVTQVLSGANTGEWGCVEYNPISNTFRLVFEALRPLSTFGAGTSFNDVVWYNGNLYMTVNDGVGLPYGVYYINWTTGAYVGTPPVFIPATTGNNYNGISVTSIPGVFIADSVTNTRYDLINTNTGVVTPLFDWTSGIYPSAEATLPQTRSVKYYMEYCNKTYVGTFTLDGLPYVPTGIASDCDITTSIPTLKAAVETAGGVLVASGTTYNLPANVRSFTVTAQTGNFDVSFDNGATYALTSRIGSRTWGEGTIETINMSNKIVVKSNGDVDVIYEL